MRVFVAGASGALGRPLVRRLVARGDTVVGLTRSPARAGFVSQLGAEPAVGDALDAAALRAIVERAAPDAVVHALTALPKGGPRRSAALSATNALRTEGTRNLLAATLATDARRFVAESMVFGYGHTGGEVATEERPFVHATGDQGLDAAVDALRSLEREVLDATAAGQIEGVVLRFGLFYGPGTSTDVWVRQLRRRLLPLPRASGGTLSWIHVEDAAQATVTALDRAPAGAVLNIVDDEPVGVHAFVRELARSAGAPRPWTVPLRVGQVVAPYATKIAQAQQRVSNARAREQLGWSPDFATYREGLARLAGEPAR